MAHECQSQAYTQSLDLTSHQNVKYYTKCSLQAHVFGYSPQQMALFWGLFGVNDLEDDNITPLLPASVHVVLPCL